MNEAKVYTCFCHKVEKTKAVTHADYRELEEQASYFRKEWNKAEGKIASLEEELASIKARAADYERAVTEQAMLTECVSVTGRDPSDVIRDVIQWHVSNAAQPVEALEFLAVAYEKSGNSLIAKALRANGPSKNAYDYEIAIKAISAALAHPRPTGEQAEEMAWTKKAAEFIEKKAQSYADEFGRDDMGSISFGAGRGADKMEEYWMSLIDLAEDFLKLGGKCQVPPDGWECSRAVGHDGQCATSPAAEPDGEVGVMPFVSHAKWPIGMYRQPGMSSITTNNHRTQAEANLTCRLLERNGYGGQCEWFPVRTWVTEDKT